MINIITAYAGTGKTTLAAMYPETVVDFVCMPFKYYLEPDVDINESCKANPCNVMHDEWPLNYIEAIKTELCDERILLIPSDLSVLSILRKKGISYTLCYPLREAKETYRQRFINRGNSEVFLSIFIGKWDWFLSKLEQTEAATRIVLEPHQFLADVIS